MSEYNELKVAIEAIRDFIDPMILSEHMDAKVAQDALARLDDALEGKPPDYDMIEALATIEACDMMQAVVGEVAEGARLLNEAVRNIKNNLSTHRARAVAKYQKLAPGMKVQVDRTAALLPIWEYGAIYEIVDWNDGAGDVLIKCDSDERRLSIVDERRLSIVDAVEMRNEWLRNHPEAFRGENDNATD